MWFRSKCCITNIIWNIWIVNSADVFRCMVHRHIHIPTVCSSKYTDTFTGEFDAKVLFTSRAVESGRGRKHATTGDSQLIVHIASRSHAAQGCFISPDIGCFRTFCPHSLLTVRNVHRTQVWRDYPLLYFPLKKASGGSVQEACSRFLNKYKGYLLSVAS